MSSLTPLDKHAIEEFIGESSKCFTKLYSAKENGFDAGVFHQKCDNRGPTLTVISDTEGHVYGGYTSVSWQSAFIPQVYDRDAFLFYRDNGSVQNMEKFSVRKCESAIAYDQTSGPIFGSEPDLGVFTGNVTRTHDGTPHAVSLKFKGASYMMPSYPLLDLEVEDIVVYSVTDSRYNLKALPWRNEPSFDNACLRTLFEDVESYWPLKDFGVPKGTVQYVNILFVGPIGAGKSTFINTVDSVFRGYATMIAIAGGKGKCMTHRYRQYHITSSDNRRYLHFRLCDTRGLEDGFSINKDFDAILEGHVPDKYNFLVSRLCEQKNTSSTYETLTVRHYVTTSKLFFIDDTVNNCY
ncbi:interferon-induced protein 44-like isoform X1 [Argopecten irradians]|uniref:interferon-induced protein 44-like isoform X1 n=1 Tax=Argopecten irradians TaxID=31199 RepID=UPI003721C4EE